MDKIILILYILVSLSILSVWTFETIERMNPNIFKLYYKTLKFKRGLSIELFLTYRCNLDCPYCNLKLAGGKIYSEESTLTEWQEFIENFPVRLKEVRLCGGEAIFYPEIVPLVKWLLSRGLHVKILTNLEEIDTLLEIPRHRRFTVSATFHKGNGVKAFYQSYQRVRRQHRITVTEIGTRTFDFSHINPLQRTIDETQHDEFRVAPDRTIFVGDRDMIIAKSK